MTDSQSTRERSANDLTVVFIAGDDCTKPLEAKANFNQARPSELIRMSFGRNQVYGFESKEAAKTFGDVLFETNVPFSYYPGSAYETLATSGMSDLQKGLMSLVSTKR